MVVVEDHPLFRQGVAAAVTNATDLVLAGDYSSLEEMRAASPEADIVVLDLHLPGADGPGAVADLVADGFHVLVVTASTARHDLVRTMGSGARGYLGKDSDGPQILDAIRRISAGSTYISPTMASLLLEADRSDVHLSPRQRQVLELVAEGMTDPEIADELGLSVHTVHTHLERTRKAIGAHRRAGLTAYARERGILRSPPRKG